MSTSEKINILQFFKRQQVLRLALIMAFKDSFLCKRFFRCIYCRCCIQYAKNQIKSLLSLILTFIKMQFTFNAYNKMQNIFKDIPFKWNIIHPFYFIKVAFIFKKIYVPEITFHLILSTFKKEIDSFTNQRCALFKLQMYSLNFERKKWWHFTKSESLTANL